MTDWRELSFLHATESEGWGVFGDGERLRRSNLGTPFHARIERIHDPEDGGGPMFKDDAEAWQFVVDRALAGSLMHKSALLRVPNHECERMGKHVGVITLFLAMKLDTTVGETP